MLEKKALDDLTVSTKKYPASGIGELGVCILKTRYSKLENNHQGVWVFQNPYIPFLKCKYYISSSGTNDGAMKYSKYFNK